MVEKHTSKARLLIADDNSEIRDVLCDLLSVDYECRMVGSAEEALALLSVTEFNLVITDIMMDGMSGLEMVPHILNLAPDTVIIMISGAQTIENAIEALRVGAFDYLTKPFDLRHVEMATRRALEHYALLESKRRYDNYMEELIKQRTAEVRRTLELLEESYQTTLKALAAVLETRDHETHSHSERVVTFSLRLGCELGLDKNQLRSLEFGALLHDIGKIAVPDAILRKPSGLTEAEWTMMRQHPSHGQQILRDIKFLEGASYVVAQHHEKWDGTGYPMGLRGEEIDFNARIFAVADAFDAITSNRVYRTGKSYERAIAELDRNSGKQFDPIVIEAFHQIPCEEWEEICHCSILKNQENACYLPTMPWQTVQSEQLK